MTRPLPMTPAMLDRIVEVETENIVRRAAPLQARPGNPSGMHIERFGAATAFAATKNSMRLYNSVLGVDEGTRAHLDDIAAFYRDHGCEGALEIVPGRMSEPFGRELGARGYAMVEFHCGLVRPLEPEDADLDVFDGVPEGVTVEALDPSDPAAFELFVDIYEEGFAGDPTPKDDLRAWRDNAGLWRFYLARVDGAPAGVGVLEIDGENALNASAATRPAFRGRRVQTALLRARIAAAARRGCDLIIGGAYFGTTSMRNHHRQGFCTAFTRGVWVPTRP